MENEALTRPVRLTERNEAPNRPWEPAWRFALAAASIEIAIILGALVVATLVTSAPVPQALEAPQWVNRWLRATIDATAIALPVGLAVHLVLSLLTRSRQLGVALQTFLYTLAGLAAGSLVWVWGLIFNSETWSLAILTAAVGMWIGFFGRLILALLEWLPLPVGMGVFAAVVAGGAFAWATVTG